MHMDAEFAAEPLWVVPILEDVQAALRQHPPTFPVPVARQEALMILDGPLHL